MEHLNAAPESADTPAGDHSPRSHKSPSVNWAVLLPSATFIIILTIWGCLAPESAKTVLGAIASWIADGFGWFYVLLGAVVLFFMIGLAASKYGHIRLGPNDSKPEFKTVTWTAMLFAVGIGTDLMYFAVAEPVTQYMSPPSTEPQTVDAAREGIVWTMFHYGIVGWAMYALMGVTLGIVAYRLGRPLIVRSSLYPVLGDKVNGKLGDAVDIAAVLATIFGVATTLGIGVSMVSVSLDVIFGIPRSLPIQLTIVALGVLVATLSAVSGVKRGIRRLSEANVIAAVILTAWIVVTGKTQYLLEGLILNVGDFFRLFPNMIFQTFAYEDTGSWMQDWTLFFWAWWVAWAAFVGLFVARISRGRTVRQVVAGTLIIPFCYIVMWVSIYGNSALDLIRSGNSDFAETTVNDPPAGFFLLLTQYPGFLFIAGAATITALLFYVTSADSAALVMANLTSKLPDENSEAGTGTRIFWALVTGALTLAMLGVGGIEALQSATVIMGLPFSIVLIFVMIGLRKILRQEHEKTTEIQAAVEPHTIV
jgi:choline/carnitine/betaine transport